ncbi:MAG: MFS transporter [Oscillospiraceae bacterium]|jgi:MFS family permease
MTLDTKNQSNKLFNRYFLLTCFIALCINLSQNMLNNVVSLYSDSLGYSTGFSGFLGFPYAIVAIFFRILGGYYTDHVSRRIVMICGCLLFGLSAWLFGALPMMWSLILFRGLQGAGYASSYTAVSTANIDVIPPKMRDRGIGYFWTSMAVAVACAGTLVLALIQGDNYMPVFVVAALFLFVGAVLSWLCNYEKKPVYKPANTDSCESVQYKGLVRFIEIKALPASILYFLFGVGIAAIAMFILLFASVRGYENAGLFFTACAVVMFFANVLSSRIYERFGAVKTLVTSFAIFVVTFLALGLIDNAAVYFAAGALYGFVQGVCTPVLYSLAVSKLPVDRRGAGGSTFFMMLDLSVGLGSLICGLLIKSFGYTVMFCFAALVQFVAILLSIAFYKKKDQKTA